MPDRRYDQNELAAILRNAAEAQAKEASGDSSSDGLTLTEIERVASEVGIDPKYISNAAETLGRAPKKRGFHLGGRPYREVIERNFDGEFDDAAWEEVVAELRASFGASGTASLIGSSREWTGGTDTMIVHFSATPKKGRTRIRLSLTHQGVFLGWMGLITTSLFGVIFTGIASDKAGAPALVTISAILAIVATFTMLTHFWVTRWHARNQEMIGMLMTRVKDLASQSSAESVAPMTHVKEELPDRLTQQH